MRGPCIEVKLEANGTNSQLICRNETIPEYL